jgi:methylenetetrahydrofolate reductase (NADPH)
MNANRARQFANSTMSLPELFQQNRTILSYELFPPKTPKGDKALASHLEKLCQFGPDFITCTYGAGGSTREKTLEIVSMVKQKFDLPVASHLTLVGSSADQLRDYLTRAKHAGIDYIVALRGDPPQGETQFKPADGGFSYANELVELIRAEFSQFSIAVGGYPEKHVEAASLESDIENLKRKVDAGADVVITQLFYNNEDYFRFCDRCTQAGIDIPIVPGILPVTNLQQIQRISDLCGAKLPDSFVQRLSENESTELQFKIGVEFAAAQVAQLLENDAPGLHFYVLNQSKATIEVLKTTPLSSRLSA